MRALGFCLLVVASLPCAAQSTHDFGAVDALIQQVVAGVPLPGASIVVVKDGATILESHYGNYGPNTRIPIASASKWVSATAIASLVDAVLLSWDSAVGSLIVDAPADKRDHAARTVLASPRRQRHRRGGLERWRLRHVSMDGHQRRSGGRVLHA